MSITFGQLKFGDGLSAQTVINDAMQQKASSKAVKSSSSRRHVTRAPTLQQLIESTAPSAAPAPTRFNPMSLGRSVASVSAASSRRRSSRRRRRVDDDDDISSSSSSSSSSFSSISSDSSAVSEDEPQAKVTVANVVLESSSTTTTATDSSDSVLWVPGVKLAATVAAGASKSKRAASAPTSQLPPLQIAVGDVVTLIDASSDALFLVVRHDATLEVGTVPSSAVVFRQASGRDPERTSGLRSRDAAIYELFETEATYVAQLKQQNAPADVVSAHEAFLKALTERVGALDASTVIGDTLAAALSTFIVESTESPRIAYYSWALGALKAATPAAHADSALLVRASDTYANVLAAAKRGVEARARVQKLAAMLGSAGENLALPARQLLREVAGLSTVDEYGRESKRHLLVFNDILLLCKKKKSLLRADELRVKKRIDLSRVRVGKSELTLKIAQDCGLEIAHGPKFVRHFALLRRSNPSELCELHAVLQEAIRTRCEQLDAGLGLPVQADVDRDEDDDVARQKSSRRMLRNTPPTSPRATSPPPIADADSPSSDGGEQDDEHAVVLPPGVRVVFALAASPESGKALVRDAASRRQATWRAVESTSDLRAQLPLPEAVSVLVLNGCVSTQRQARQFEATVTRPARVVLLDNGTAANSDFQLVLNLYDGMSSADGGPLLAVLRGEQCSDSSALIAAIEGVHSLPDDDELPDYQSDAVTVAAPLSPPPPPPPSYEAVMRTSKPALLCAYRWDDVSKLPHFVGTMSASDIYVLLQAAKERTAVLRVADGGDRIEIAAIMRDDESRHAKSGRALVFLPVLSTGEGSGASADAGPPLFYVPSMPHLAATIGSLLEALALTPFVPRQFHQFTWCGAASPGVCLHCLETMMEQHLRCRQCFRVVHIACAPNVAFGVCVGIALTPAETRLRLCRRVFDTLDTERTGYLLPAVLQRVFNMTDDDVARVLARADSNDDGKIEFDEFERLLQKRFLTAFESLDVDSDGLLSVDEVSSGLARVGQVPQSAVDAYVAKLRATNARHIDFRDFVMAFFVAIVAANELNH
jgi:Ca2+-binding EF-hand superfamily protein